MTAAERLKELRVDNDLKQEAVAKMLKITKQQYSLYETGQREFKLHHIVALCNYYGVASDYILGLPKGLKYPER